MGRRRRSEVIIILKYTGEGGGGEVLLLLPLSIYFFDVVAWKDALPPIVQLGVSKLEIQGVWLRAKFL